MSTPFKKFFNKINSSSFDDDNRDILFRDMLLQYELYDDFFTEIVDLPYTFFTSHSLSRIIYSYYQSLSTLLKTKFLSSLISTTFVNLCFLTYNPVTLFFEDVLKSEENNQLIVQSIQQSCTYPYALFLFIKRFKQINWAYEKGIYTKCTIFEFILHENNYTEKSELVENICTLCNLMVDCKLIHNQQNYQNPSESTYNIPQLICGLYEQKKFLQEIKIPLKEMFHYFSTDSFEDAINDFNFFQSFSKKIFSSETEVIEFIKSYYNFHHSYSEWTCVFDKVDSENQNLFSYIQDLSILKALLQNQNIPEKYKIFFYQNSYCKISRNFMLYESSSFLYNKINVMQILDFFDLICIPTGFCNLLSDPLIEVSDKYNNFLLKMKQKCVSSFQFFEKTVSKTIPKELYTEIFKYVCPMNV